MGQISALYGTNPLYTFEQSYVLKRVDKGLKKGQFCSFLIY